MEGGIFKTISLEDNKSADFFILYGNQKVILKVAYYTQDEHISSVEIESKKVPEQNMTSTQFASAMKLLDKAEKIKSDAQYAYKTASRYLPKQ